jgi:hypothetical protein
MLRSLFIASVFVGSLLFNACSIGTQQSDRTERLQRIDSSLTQVYDMFNRAGTTIGQPDVIMIIYTLRQHFNLNFPFPTLPSFLEKRPYLLDRYFKLYDQYFDGKFYVNYSDEDVKLFLDNSLESDINALTFWSMYCNKYPLDERFLGEMKKKLHSPPMYPSITDRSVPPPEYWPLHAALQLVSAHNNGCLTESAELNEIRAEVERKVNDIAKGQIETVQYNLDIQTEALAMLYYMEMDDQVTEDQINELLSHQLKGGGWAYATGSESVSLHTSALAMWVLLEYKESLQAS